MFALDHWRTTVPGQNPTLSAIVRKRTNVVAVELLAPKANREHAASGRLFSFGLFRDLLRLLMALNHGGVRRTMFAVCVL